MSSLLMFFLRSAGRACGIAGKFALLILVMRTHGADSFAIFAIVQGWAVFTSKLLGLGAIYWLNRRVARSSSHHRVYLLIHACFCLASYVTLAVILFLGQPYAQYISWVTLLAVLVAEHAATEANLLAYYGQRHLAADLAMLVRNIWPVAAIALLLLRPGAPIALVYWTWIASGLIASAIALSSVRYWRKPSRQQWRQAFSVSPAMIRLSFGPLVAALAYTAAISLDRQMLQWTSSLAETAIYSFYASCAAAVAAVLQFGFTLPASAKLVGAAGPRLSDQSLVEKADGLRRVLLAVCVALALAIPAGYVVAIHFGWLANLKLGNHILAMGAGFVGLALSRIWFEFETSIDYVFRRNERIRRLNLMLAVTVSALVSFGGWAAGALGAMSGMIVAFVLVLVFRLVSARRAPTGGSSIPAPVQP